MVLVFQWDSTQDLEGGVKSQQVVARKNSAALEERISDGCFSVGRVYNGGRCLLWRKVSSAPHGAGALNQVRDVRRGARSFCKERCIGSYDVTPLAKVGFVRELPVWNHIR